MADFDDSLSGLESLHRDLDLLTKSQLPTLDRLLQKLEDCLDEFKTLLDKRPKDNTSRTTLSAGKITIGEEEYEVNEEFQQQTLELAEVLNLDELEAAALFHGAAPDAQEIERSQLQAAIIRFHRRREFVLLCLRILVKTALDNGDTDLDGQPALLMAVRIITGVEGVNFEPAHKFWAKSLAAMEAIEVWLRQISDRVDSNKVTGQVTSRDFDEIMTYQQDSLTRQHGYLAAICTHMVKAGFASLGNFNALLARARTIDRHDIITIHYIPMIIRLASWVALESSTTTKEVRALHDTLMAGRESDNWALRNFHAATVTWWLAEYSGRYVDPNLQDPDLRNIKFDDEANGRSETFLKALSDGAFHFMLSVSQDVRPTEWYDPTKTSMIKSLMQDTQILAPGMRRPDISFRNLLMEQLQTFVDSFITNMPDTLRRLKAEEDDQRRQLQMHFQRSTGEHPLHLERFLVIISFAFDGFVEAAEEFWNDKESNLYGFLQWAAKRQPTPRIAMFCEMLRAISTGEQNADSAHKFLMEEGGPLSGKLRRISSLSYTHIFNELLEFQTNIHEPKKTIQGGMYAQSQQNPIDQIVEPESGVMLESYLRLLAHLCRQGSSARNWMLEEKEYNLAGICFRLCNDKVESQIRAAAFDAVSALLVDKDALRAASIWNQLDSWTVSGFYVGSKQNNALSPVSRDELWSTLADGYEESIAFIHLLQALVDPYADEQGLNDSLPFPEDLGSARRMPGIEKYIDFVLQVFSERCEKVEDPLQRNVMRCACLRFIITCLATFNENLVVFANKSNVPVDSVIAPTNLAVYVTLHPFTRVMAWLFNDKALKALFAASHQNDAEFEGAAQDSPLVQSVMSSIAVMNLVMKLQATYLDIVRPLLKQQSSHQHSSVSNLSLASFEDAVLNNLQVIVDLGHYCGTENHDLIIASLRLLERLSSSRKLAVSPAGFSQRSSRSKIVGILEKDDESTRIGRCLSDLMRLSEEELEAGPDSPGYIVKLGVVDFLNSCLSAVSLRPTIAHVLLGFACSGSTVRIAEDGLWANGQSLFHAIMLLAVKYPDNDDETFLAWSSDIKARCWDILQKLWRSPLTSTLVMDELRHNELLFIQAPTLSVITADTPWEGISLAQGLEIQADADFSDFFCGPPAAALQNFLRQRATFLDYESRELRSTVMGGLTSLKSRVQSVLLGTTIRPGEEPVANPNIFDLFDFIEFSYPERRIPDLHPLLEGISLSTLQEEKNGVLVYEIPLLEQFFLLRMKFWDRGGMFKTDDERIAMLEAAQTLLGVFTDWNRRAQLLHCHKDILRSWVQVLTVTLEGCDFEVSARTSFILQTIQVILPKLEMSYNDDTSTALQLIGLSDALIQKIDFDSTAFEKTRTGDFANDRLSQLFRAALAGIYSPVTTPEIREYCYQICFRYIQGTFSKAIKGSPLGRHTLNSVKNCGNHLLEVICDDAYSGQGTCKVSALLLLGGLVAMAIRQESKYILESFVSLNFIGVLVDNIKHIPEELRAASAPQVPILLAYYDASLALLLRICQTRLGAAYVLNAGLFPSIRDSRIFDVDPDIGLEFDNPNALKKYYELMLAVLRVINAAVIARGRQNDQTIFQAREFLKENRHSMVAIFKRSVNVGVGSTQVLGDAEDLGDLVDCFTVLVEITGFLQVCSPPRDMLQIGIDC
jgi:nuclear pore complex protein Nup205